MKYSQKSAPIINALREHLAGKYISFHTPGHKSGKGVDNSLKSLMADRPFEIDLTELPGLDDLHNPRGCIEAAQQLAAQAFGAAKTYYLVNGTSCGIQAAIMGVCKQGHKLLLPRNAHRSVVAGLILSGAKPLWVPVDIDGEFLVPEALKAEDVQKSLQKDSEIKGIFCVHPTYHGYCSPLKAIISLGSQYNIPVLVDEAHGPHFHFHEKLPSSAMALQADISIQSTHKMLSAVNQGSMLHVGKNSKVNADEIYQQLFILQTTSPSYTVLASLDAARRQMALEGQFLLEECIHLAQYLREQINYIEGLICADTDDPCKVLISVKGLNLSGYEAARQLRIESKIQIELADNQNILLNITIGNTWQDINGFLKGLRLLKKTGGESKSDTTIQILELFSDFAEPVCEMIPREAWFGRKRKVAPDEAAGCISGDIIAAYPPGIPLLCPGEKVTGTIIEILKNMKKLDINIQSTGDSELSYINVLD